MAVNNRNMPVPLETAGRLEIRDQLDYLLFQNAVRSDGSQALQAKVRVRLGLDPTDFAAWQIDSNAKGFIDGFTLEWDAQPGVIAYFYFAKGPNPIEVRSPPATQLVTSSIGTSIATAAVSVGTSATLLSAADSLRQAVTIQNNDASADLYVGGSGVTTATGIKVPAGGSITLDKTTAAIYGRVSSGTVDARVLEEKS